MTITKPKTSKRSKYEVTKLATSLDEVMACEFVYDGRVVHVGWYGSWQARQLQNMIKQGRIWHVKLKEGK